MTRHMTLGLILALALVSPLAAQDAPDPKPADKPAAKPTDTPADKPDAKPADEPDAKPADKPDTKPADKPDAKPADKPDAAPAKVDLSKLEDGLYAIIETSYGPVVARLHYKRAPLTVGSFVGLATGKIGWIKTQGGEEPKGEKSNEPYYDGLTFHRIVPEFVVQGGCPFGTGLGGPGYSFREEVHPDLEHDSEGVLSMARTNQRATTGSQFFITLGPTPSLDQRGPYSVFGKVVSGMENIHKMVKETGALPVKPGEKAKPAPTMKSIRIHAVGAEAKAFDPLNATAKDLPEPTAEVDPARVPAADAEERDEANVDGMVIFHKGLDSMPPVLGPNKEEAKAIAAKLVRLARSKGADWVKLANRWSDIKPGFEGLELKKSAKMPKAFEPVMKLAPGQISDPVWVENYGWMIFKANKPLGKVKCRHILIMHNDSMRKPPHVKRTKEEAKKLAEDLLAKIKGGADFVELAKQHHDNKTNPTGDLPEFGRKGQMIEEFAKAAFELEIGEVSGVVETAFGFHIIQRLKPEVKITCKHLLVMHTGSMRVPPNIKRSKDEAKARCEEALAKIKGGAKFGDVVREYHDNKSNLTGDLPPFGRKGQMVEEFSKAAFELKPGEISGVVESPFGFHIIKRLK